MKFIDGFVIFLMSITLGGGLGTLITLYFMNKRMDKLRIAIAEMRAQHNRQKTQAAQKAAETRKNRKAMRKAAAEANAYMKELEKFG